MSNRFLSSSAISNIATETTSKEIEEELRNGHLNTLKNATVADDPTDTADLSTIQGLLRNHIYAQAVGPDNAHRVGASSGVTRFQYAGSIEVTNNLTTFITGMPDGEIQAYNRAGNVLSVASTSANDTLLGTGARLVLIEYIATDYTNDFILVEMNGTTEVEIPSPTPPIAFVQTIITGTTGSLLTNDGDIFCGLATSDGGAWVGGQPSAGNIWNVCGAGLALSQNMSAMVPKDEVWLFNNLTITSDSTNKNDALDVSLFSNQQSIGDYVNVKYFSMHLVGTVNAPLPSFRQYVSGDVFYFQVINGGAQTNFVTLLLGIMRLKTSVYPNVGGFPVF